jgi:hypothetical protein
MAITFGFHKMLRISEADEQLAVSQAGFSSMEFVGHFLSNRKHAVSPI